MQSRQPRQANPIPHIIAAISAARSWCIQMYPQIKSSLRWFFELFVHEVAKYFYKQVARIIYVVWAIFTFIIGYRVFVAGSIQLKVGAKTEITPIAITGEWAARLVVTFWIIIALGLIWAIINTVQYFREWASGKRKITLHSLSERIESMSLDIASIKTRFGVTEEQKEKGQKHTKNTKKKTKQQKPKPRNK